MSRDTQGADDDLSDYAAWLRLAGSPSTARMRLQHVRRFAHGIAGEGGLHEVEPSQLVRYIADQEWSQESRRSFAASLRSYYRWAVRAGRIANDPTREMPTLPARRGFPRPASEDAVRAGLAADDARVRLMVRLASEAGLRCIELARLHSRDLRHDEREGWLLTVRGKGDTRRIVPVSSSLAEDLSARAPGYLFPGQDAGHLSAQYVSRIIGRALPPGVSAHQLRHRFASRAYAGSGGDLRAVQELLGHAKITTTQVYTAVPEGALRRAVAAADTATAASPGPLFHVTAHRLPNRDGVGNRGRVRDRATAPAVRSEEHDGPEPTRQRWASLTLRSPGLVSAAHLELLWSKRSGRDHLGPIAGPVMLEPPLMLEDVHDRADRVIQDLGFRRSGDWEDARAGIVAWIEPSVTGRPAAQA